MLGGKGGGRILLAQKRMGKEGCPCVIPMPEVREGKKGKLLLHKKGSPPAA